MASVRSSSQLPCLPALGFLNVELDAKEHQCQNGLHRDFRRLAEPPESAPADSGRTKLVPRSSVPEYLV